MAHVTLGLLTVTSKHEHHYLTETAKMSKLYDIECVRFTPGAIDPKTLRIDGERFCTKSEEWQTDNFSIPDYIYDRCFYNRKAKKEKPIVDWLKNYPKTTFLGYGLPDKWTLYQSLKSDSTIGCYLPATTLVQSPNQILAHLRSHSNCLIKPRNGSRGVGILAIQLASNTIKVTYHKGRDKKTKNFHSIKEFNIWIEKLIAQNDYLLQPLLQLNDKQSFPFDIRLFMQKNGNGQWELVEKGIRKGYKGSFLSNLYSGGETINYSEWCLSLSNKQKTLLEDNLQTIVSQLPHILENRFQRLFEIGIDIGYAQDESVWILDINSKPGRKTILTTSPHLSNRLYEAPLAYCHYLSQQSLLKEPN
ncbi:YheC/YheD family endospore coat-associated protein [Metabacillus malikii]|uniref:Glutathione synthase/RimK-type ligase-like ATP-grasp enzyme n=1 Tax=Metabacillus malikii TaxID=1504265 RepID=A0ABT9ZJ65_9BACI|nr:YheC/YheD family protein [Metabacillus malikii]MDQ0232333.1 glutathione synthase/RimK-type ligase-like ATP-grasp enzyme [Metabacillus malikii]